MLEEIIQEPISVLIYGVDEGSLVLGHSMIFYILYDTIILESLCCPVYAIRTLRNIEFVDCHTTLKLTQFTEETIDIEWARWKCASREVGAKPVSYVY